MIRYTLHILTLIAVLCGQLIASDPPKRKTKTDVVKTNFEVGGGLMGSVLYLSRNIQEDNDALGYTIVANYGGHKLLRYSIQYTYYKPINIEPTWYTIRANTFEFNTEILARFPNNKTYLYPFLGLSYNTFRGYFTGQNDYLNLREQFKANTTIKNNWLGLNLGTGFEHAFGPVVIFFDYRMRVGRERGWSFNIMDVCYGGGLRVKLFMPTFKSIFHGWRNRYGRV